MDWDALVCFRLLDVRVLFALFGRLFRATLIRNCGLISEASSSSSDYVNDRYAERSRNCVFSDGFYICHEGGEI
jgi:hypothetical protein